MGFFAMTDGIYFHLGLLRQAFQWGFTDVATSLWLLFQFLARPYLKGDMVRPAMQSGPCMAQLFFHLFSAALACLSHNLGHELKSPGLERFR
jgi:hypothetical protein